MGWTVYSPGTGGLLPIKEGVTFVDKLDQKWRVLNFQSTLRNGSIMIGFQCALLGEGDITLSTAIFPWATVVSGLQSTSQAK